MKIAPPVELEPTVDISRHACRHGRRTAGEADTANVDGAGQPRVRYGERRRRELKIIQAHDRFVAELVAIQRGNGNRYTLRTFRSSLGRDDDFFQDILGRFCGENRKRDDRPGR